MERLDLLCYILMSVYLCVRANSGDCDIYKDCVECKAFSTGAFGIMDCVHHCDIATYIPVDDDGFEERSGLTLCSYKNAENCRFSFRIGKETEYGPDLYVKEELDCLTYEPTYAPVVTIDVTLEPTTSMTTSATVKQEKDTDTDSKTDGMQSDAEITEDAEAVSGSKKDSNLGSKEGHSDTNNLNKSAIVTTSMLTLTLCFFASLCKLL